MCNAWNHPPGCSCGWGGGWRGSGSFTHIQPVTYETFTRPTGCPVCGAPVFFYQSPEKGRVFFDSLGPPWPKHPCTDNGRPVSLSRENTTFPSNKSSGNQRPSLLPWQREGWQPFIVSFVLDFHPQLLRVSASVQGQEVEVYVVKRSLKQATSPRDFILGSVIQSRVKNKGDYELSLLGTDLRPLQLIGYVSSINALNVAPQGFSGARRRSAYRPNR